MPPEALPKYHAVIESGKAEFVNGTRLIYPMENEAMRPLNLIANRCFAYLFSYLVNTRLTDTLCGTKVLMRKDYEVLARERGYFGNFDPFGDFDLIFGAAKQNTQDHRDPDPLQGAHLRRDPDLAFSGRLAAAENGVVRLSQAQGRLIPE